MTEITLRYDAVQKSIVSEAVYTEAVDQCANFNLRLKQERRLRLPFLDSQTGVAQSHTDLWHSYRHRKPGKFHGQIYSYPERRWKKKKHFFLFSERSMKAGDIETGEADMHQISTVENPAAATTTTTTTEEMPELKSEVVREKWYDEYDEYLEPPDAGEMCDDQSDISDFEDQYMKKKKKKGKGGAKGRKRKQEKDDKDKTDEEREKPFGCEVKTPPKQRKEEEKVKTPPRPRKEEEKAKPTPVFIVPERGEDGKVQSSNYCDFCLGDADENKKTGTAEELVSCSDCGRSGHPTCLQFTDNMTISVKKYPWQCIECKSCGLCGTSENDEQLLFCDDCDRGYHMYCLNPPLAEAPEGNWSCYLCIEEFHGGKKPAGMV